MNKTNLIWIKSIKSEKIGINNQKNMQSTFSGVKIVFPQIFPDNRGDFSFRELSKEWIQENISTSKLGVFRGFHAQFGENAQAKRVRVLSGKALDFIIDFRKESQTYLQKEYFMLEGETKAEIFIPAGCLHAFVSLKEGTIFQYLVDKPYDPKNEISVNLNSFPDLKKIIETELEKNNYKDGLIISKKDASAPLIDEFIHS